MIYLLVLLVKRKKSILQYFAFDTIKVAATRSLVALLKERWYVVKSYAALQLTSII